MRDKLVIKNDDTYDVAMHEIDALMKKGEDNLTQTEVERLREMAEAAESFEDKCLWGDPSARSYSTGEVSDATKAK
ncbi:hypothetical protein [Pinibacter aurantiacus]|uniref:Uncharacterized protein n=1 Tax=Pinibacter aurantiacus TaxID=2851599 RepID=A0A9E2S7V3_9BACT|nr:hypothetical protein [Pinibacter aurantiacus]MBV4356124.1 hypothetical protein [Pinibacter aurantiacus]